VSYSLIANRRDFIRTLAGGAGLALAAGSATAQSAATAWYRGNLHTHTINSDGDSPPYDVMAWYKRNGYQFLALTDPTRLPTRPCSTQIPTTTSCSSGPKKSPIR
jgi:hypothetical protein